MKPLLRLRAPGMTAVEFALWLVAFVVVLGCLLITAVQALAAPVL